MILLCISYVILYNFEDTKLIRGHIASVALIGVWTNLTVLMGKIPAAGIYIIMIANVAKAPWTGVWSEWRKRRTCQESPQK